MISQLRNSKRFNIIILLGLISLFCFSLSLVRFYFSENKVFLFLNWNLFLAFIPWALSGIISSNKNYQENKFALFLLLAGWLLFFPNAPYILTDLFHLHSRGHIPIWFDLVVILSFAWTGLAYGFISLLEIESLLSKYLRSKTVAITSIIFLFIGSFGIYIGRYLRWNSWDILTNPFPLIAEVSDRFINPTSHPRTWAMTILMGFLLNMMFWTFKFISSNKAFAVHNIK
jgi:uncharacterized membrane protein